LEKDIEEQGQFDVIFTKMTSDLIKAKKKNDDQAKKRIENLQVNTDKLRVLSIMA
jgi:hypothetical protein